MGPDITFKIKNRGKEIFSNRKLMVERKYVLVFSPSALKFPYLDLFPICYTLGRWNRVIEK